MRESGLNWWARFRCEVLGWHTPMPMIDFDGASFASNCARCKRRVLQDSQGNWFAIHD